VTLQQSAAGVVSVKPGGILDTHVGAAAAIAKSKLAALNVGDADIAAGGLTNAAIAAAAGIAKSKLAALAIGASDLAASVRSEFFEFVFDFNATTNPGANVDAFFSVNEGQGGAVANYASVEGNAKLPISRASILQDVRARIATQPAVGETVTIAFRVNGVDQGVLTFTNADAAGTIKTAQPALSLAVNDLVNWRVRTSSAAGAPKGGAAAMVEVD
jgi:hypothetical protein